MPSAEPRAHSFVATWGVACALMLGPLLIFLRFHQLPFASAEVLAVTGLGALAAAAVGALLERAGSAVRALGVGALAVLFADLQRTTPLGIPGLIGIGVAAAAAAWTLRAVWRPIVGPVAWTFTLAAALLSGGGDRATAGIDRPPAPRNRALPPRLHLILDEQIGVEGIPRAFDPDGHFARALRDAYLSRGFSVFGRAYSRYFMSHDSFSALFNRGDALRHSGRGRRVALEHSAYFEELQRRGYALRVLRTDYLDLCSAERGFELEHCSVSAVESPRVLPDSGLPVATRLRLLGGMLTRLSSLIPDQPVSRVSSLVAMRSLGRLREEIDQRLEPGVALIAHLMLPHFPFAYEADCTLRSDPSTWTYGEPGVLHATHFSEATRAVHYPLYLEQMACTTRRVTALLDRLSARPETLDSVVIVHGDHGSRITARRPAPSNRNLLTPADLRDGFSTLFAVRRPGVPAHYDDRLLPIDALLDATLAAGPIPRGAQWQQPAEIVIEDRWTRLRIPLAPFERVELRPATGD